MGSSRFVWDEYVFGIMYFLLGMAVLFIAIAIPYEQWEHVFIGTGGLTIAILSIGSFIINPVLPDNVKIPEGLLGIIMALTGCMMVISICMLTVSVIA